MKRIVMINGDRYRLIKRKKRKAKAGEYFWDGDAGKFKQSIALTADKFYCYEFEGKGRFYVYQKRRMKNNSKESSFSHQYVVRDCKIGKTVTLVFHEDYVDVVLQALNNSATANYTSPDPWSS